MNTKKAQERWDFKVTLNLNNILKEIRDYVVKNPEFLQNLD